MNKTKMQKAQVITTLKHTLHESNAIVVAHYTGLTVSEMTLLRKRLKEKGASFTVTKNRLIKIALKDSSFAALDKFFQGPTAIAYSKDPVSAAKGMVEFAKENEKLVIVGGALNDNIMNVEQVKSLAKLPSLDELRATLISLIQTPATRIAGVLQAPAGQVARVLQAHSQQGDK